MRKKVERQDFQQSPIAMYPLGLLIYILEKSLEEYSL